MNKLYSIALIFCFLLVNAQAYTSAYVFWVRSPEKTDTTKKQASRPAKITDTRREKPAYLKNGVNVTITPFKPGSGTKQADAGGSSAAAVSSKAVQPQEIKVLSNVKVYPNPVGEELNLSYFVNKDSNVTIKIMDVLGNEIATLLSQRIPAGEQTNTFSIASKLSSGFYFIRLIAGNETVVKRVSIL
ncbi:T9SS type A sorting domain-containing protein [Desertivirga xinjiangensis]|uniref:T9SS type A sorting domain-containing protein n=1 Tax=Desertivirga xinjiangensis TaxID=539206 RepID=UPI00210CAA15|nr:T9SS type A sorting domain-containing protein [Pedobacter xinjiangensis]